MSYILENKDEYNRLEFQAKQSAYSIGDELRFLNLPSKAKILDAGCGSGVAFKHLSEVFALESIYACDRSELRLAQAKSSLPRHLESKVNFSNQDLNELDLTPDSLDAVISRYVYEYLEDPYKVSSEFYKVLKPGGVCYLVDFDGIVFNLYSSNIKLNEYLLKFKNELKEDYFVGRRLPDTLKKAGFKNIKWTAQVFSFQGESLEEEIWNMEQRLELALPRMTEMLKSETKAREFKDLYLQEMAVETNTLFYNKFITYGFK